MIKVILSDLDGTLFKDHSKDSVFELSSRNEEGLERLKNSDIKLCLATGRGVPTGIQLFNKYGLPITVIGGHHGANCYDEDHYAYINTLDFNSGKKIYEDIKKRDFEQFIVKSHQDNRVVAKKDDPIVMQTINGKDVFGDLKDYSVEDYFSGKIKDEDLSLMLIRMKTQDEVEELIPYLKEKFAEDVFTVKGFYKAAELIPVGCSKGKIVKYIMNKYHLSKDEIAVVGDDLNDLEMFECSNYTFGINTGDPRIMPYVKYVVEDVAECIDQCIEINKNMKE